MSANTNTAIPLPAGAVEVADWHNPAQPVDADWDGAPGSMRYFVGRSWTVECGVDPGDAITVIIDGHQHDDGRVERAVLVDGAPLTVEQAEQLAGVLRAAVDEARRASALDDETSASR